ncbi:MAG: ABC transporter substrate-binding protein [Brachymonas sp.]|nr:ABC transporter substrate-binding protein [Brachymonas sp.]
MQKIVALNSDALEALRILQADPQVVGVYSDIAHETAFWPEMQGKPQVGKWNEPNIEAIAQLAPDLVIHYSSGSPHLEAKLQPLGIRVLRLDLFRIDTLEREITQLGAVLGKQEEAQRFTAWHRGIVDTVQQQAALAPAPVRAYLENYADYSVSGPGSALHQLCNLANCVNVAAHLKAAYPKVPPEWVVAENPAVIFKLTGKVDGYAQKDASDYNLIRDRIRARPAWAHIDAIQHQRVHVMDAALTSGPRVAVALAYLARWTHPEQVRVDPDALHRAYMEQFMRKPFQGHYSSGKLLP